MKTNHLKTDKALSQKISVSVVRTTIVFSLKVSKDLSQEWAKEALCTRQSFDKFIMWRENVSNLFRFNLQSEEACK